MKYKSYFFYLGIIIGTSGLFTVSLFLLVPAGRASELDSVAATDVAPVAPTDVAPVAVTDVSPETPEDDPVAPEASMEFPARKNKGDNNKDK